jgi:hypothetical protein
MSRQVIRVVGRSVVGRLMGVYQLVEDLAPRLELAFLDSEIPSKDTQSVMLDLLARQLGPYTVTKIDSR